MRKLLAIVVGLISLVVIALSASYAALHTKYAPQVINTVFQYLYQDKVQVREVLYSYQEPRHLQFNGVLIQSSQPDPILIDKIDVWIGERPWQWQQHQLQIDNVLIDGLNLQQGWPKMAAPKWVKVNQLSVVNISINQDGWVGRDVSLQIKQPQIRSSKLLPFYGEIQMSAEQIYWQGEALNKVYLDADITPEHSTVYDLRFQWRKGEFSAQATKQQTQERWTLPHVNISGLRLQQSNLDNISPTSMKWFNQLSMKIEELEINNSSIETPRFSANNIQLTAAHLDFPFNKWQQQDASLFVTAESMSTVGQAIHAPAFDISFQPNKINIQDISLEMLQGNLHLQGTVTPTSLNLAQLNINNMKWIPTPDAKEMVFEYFRRLDNIQAKMVTVNHVQFIDLTTSPPKQATGLSIEGDDIEIKKSGQWGLWKGKLTVTANRASYDSVNSKNLLVSMNSEDGHFWLEKLFIPLDDGLVKGTGDMAFAQTSQPWKLDLEASGIPLRFFSRWFNLPLHLDGITDFTVKGEGLYGDQLIFNHSVTGTLNASVAQATSRDNFQALWQRNQGITIPALVPPQEQKADNTGGDIAPKGSSQPENRAPENKAQPVIISDIHLVADRGRLSLQPFAIEGDDFTVKLGGKYDFLFPDKGNLQYRLEGECQALTYDLLGPKDSVLIENQCH